MTTRTVAKCETCKGRGFDTLHDEFETPVQVECDDCDGRGVSEIPTAEELAQQAADRETRIARRNEEHFSKGWHDKLCSSNHCRLGLA